MFKKVYVEITNICNLKCPFCIKNSRQENFLTKEQFDIILNKLEGYTKYLYFHILGEPLMHPNINELIDMSSKRFYINITTNGYLIKNIQDNKNIRQLNISLHSFNPQNGKPLNEYMQDILNVTDKLSKYTYINYRLWVNSTYKDDIIKILNKHYSISIDGTTKLAKNVFIDFAKEFIWPDINNNLTKQAGKCYGLTDHIGILVDGSIVPCCLDSKGCITLGNIYKDNLEQILNTAFVKQMQNDLKNGNRKQELCQHCGYKVLNKLDF